MITIKSNIKIREVYKIKYKNLLRISLMMVLITKNVVDHTIFSDISMFIFSIVSICFMAKTKKIYFSKYYFVPLIFIIYHFILILLGFAMNSNVSLKMINTLIINICLIIAVYNYIISFNNINDFMKMCVYVSIISLVLIVIFLKGDVFTGRFGHTWRQSVSYYVMGQAVYLSANAVSNFCSIGFFISSIIYIKEKRKIYILFNLILVIGIFLSGSRKGILLLILYFAYIIWNIYGKNVFKLIGVSILVFSIIYILIFKVPLFYENIGVRVEDLIESLVTKNLIDASAETRIKLINIAKPAIIKRPVIGYGLGSFKLISNNLGLDNNYYDLLMSGGIIGFIIYYSYILLAIIKYKKLRYYENIKYAKPLFFIIISFLLLDIGTVTYSTFIFQFWIIAYFAVCNVSNSNERIMGWYIERE